MLTHSLFQNIYLILSIGAINAIRGSGWANNTRYATIFSHRLLYVIWIACMITAYIPNIPFVIPLILLLWLGFAPGWGLYMNASYPNMSYVNESEVKPIDWILNKTIGRPTTAGQFSLWCTIAMGLRGLLFYPTFCLLSFIYPHALFYGLGMAGMGLIYWSIRIVPVNYHVRVAEFLTGCLLGGLVVLST